MGNINSIQWSEDMSTGDSRSDLEHQTIITLYNDFARSCRLQVSSIMKTELAEDVCCFILRHLERDRVSLPLPEIMIENYIGDFRRHDKSFILDLLLALYMDGDMYAAAHSLRNYILEHIQANVRHASRALPAEGSLGQG